MTRRQHVRGATVTAVIVAALTRAAYGDPSPPSVEVPGFWHVSVPWHLLTDSGTKLDLPPAFILSEPTYSKLDTELRRLQDQETRQTAEIKSYKAAIEKWQPGWYTVAGAVASGVVLGWYAHSHL